jgi:hypothetical protein
VKLALLLPVALVACTLKPVPSDGDEGGGGSGGGSAGAPAGECSTITDCDVCRSCAAGDPCADELATCVDMPSCVAIDECISTCGATAEECWATCRGQNPQGRPAFDAAWTCLGCEQCQTACGAVPICE